MSSRRHRRCGRTYNEMESTGRRKQDETQEFKNGTAAEINRWVDDQPVTDLDMDHVMIESEIGGNTHSFVQEDEIEDEMSSSCSSSSSDSDSSETDLSECPDEEVKKFLKEVHQRKLIAYKRASSPYTNNERQLRKHVRILRSNTTDEIIIFPHAGKPRIIRVLPRIRETPSLSVNPRDDLMQEWIENFLHLS